MHLKAIIAGIAFVSALASHYACFQWGASSNQAEREAKTASLQKKVYEQGRKLQMALDDAAELTQSLTIINGERINGIDTLEKRDRELLRLEDMLATALDERDSARNLRIVDINHHASVYRTAVNRCDGLPASEAAFLVPVELQQSASQLLAEGTKRLVKRYCEIAVNYNSLHISYTEAVK